MLKVRRNRTIPTTITTMDTIAQVRRTGKSTGDETEKSSRFTLIVQATARDRMPRTMAQKEPAVSKPLPNFASPIPRDLIVCNPFQGLLPCNKHCSLMAVCHQKTPGFIPRNLSFSGGRPFPQMLRYFGAHKSAVQRHIAQHSRNISRRYLLNTLRAKVLMQYY